MFGATFDDYYRSVFDQFKQDILHESDTQILGSEIDDLAKFYFQKYALEPLDFDPADISYEAKKEMRVVPGHQREKGYGSSAINWEYECARISIPVQSNQNLNWIKKLNGATVYMDGFDQSVNYQQNEVSFSFDTKWYGGSMNEDGIAHEVNTKSERLLKMLADKNNDIKSENIKLMQAIKDVISQRKIKINADKEKLNSLSQKINIPLKQKVGVGAVRVHVLPKDFVRVEKPTPKAPEQYILAEENLLPILDFVDFQMRSLEGTPKSVKMLGEEQLRDLILSGLNGAFKGDATGETFVKKGKTDIHLKIERGEILIFECKIWGGEAIYLGTIDQLIGYVTWRQNYGVVIMFCKNKDFSKILFQIPNIIQKHPQYIRGYKKINESHFTSEHTLPDDNGKIIKIHHLIYNLYSE